MTVPSLVGALAGLGVLAVLAVIAWRPIVGLYVVAACVVLIEAEPLELGVLTDRLYLYHWPAGLAGRGERPIGLLLLFVLGAAVYHRLRGRRRALEAGPLGLPFAAFLLCVAWGAVNGLALGGNFRIIVLEVRPFWYLLLAYLLAYNLVERAWHVRALVWTIVLGAGVKSLQGVYVYLGVLHGRLDGHHEILAHEESFFLAAVVVLGVAFFLIHRGHAEYRAILQILPLVAVTLIANQRRAAYGALLVGSGVAWALAFVLEPRARGRLMRVLAVALPLGVGYVLVFFADPTFAARPARAIVSIVHPDPTDTVSRNSSRYRALENHNLEFTAMQRPILGWGFGRPFVQDVAMPDFSARSRYYLYIPHNTIYWVWMRLGVVGFLALWFLLGSIVVRGGLIAARLGDGYLRTVAVFVVATTLMEILFASADFQLYSHRNVLYLGLLAGVLMRLPRCEADSTRAAAPRLS